jgi:hypothetical protein
VTSGNPELSFFLDLWLPLLKSQISLKHNPVLLDNILLISFVIPPIYFLGDKSKSFSWISSRLARYSVLFLGSKDVNADKTLFISCELIAVCVFLRCY